MRKAFADTLIKLFRQRDNAILLTGDLGFGVFDELQAEFPDRFINIGIAEQAMVDIAGGLAADGYRPIVYSIASFMTGRAYEQIKLLAYQNLPVVVVGAGGGYCYSKAGSTHHAADDLGLMSLIPDMVVTCPGCPDEVSELLKQLMTIPSTSYMRIGKYGEPNYGSPNSITVGKARCLHAGEGATVVTTGDIAAIAANIVGPAVWHFPTIKPLDTSRLAELDEPILVVEEASPAGGLYSAIMNTGLKKDVVRIGPPDEFLTDCVGRDAILSKWNMDLESIQKEIWGLVV